MERIINGETRLTLNEAKELYTHAMNTTDLDLRKLYLDKIVLGTLYVVKKYLKDYNFKIFESASIGYEDIESAFIEEWIKCIYNGDIMNIDYYSKMFSVVFYNAAFANLGIEDVPVSFLFNINIHRFVDLFMVYIDMRNQYKDVNVRSFDEALNDNYLQRASEYFNISLIFDTMEAMYNYMDIDPDLGVNINKTQVLKCIKLLISNGMFEQLTNDYADNSVEDEVLTKMYNDDFVKSVFSKIDDEREKAILKSRVGFDDDVEKSLGELAEEYRVSKGRIQQLLKRVSDRLTDDEHIQSFKETTSRKKIKW